MAEALQLATAKALARGKRQHQRQATLGLNRGEVVVMWIGY